MAESKWKNHQRTLIVCSRGVTQNQRHLINDLVKLLPHSKKEAKVDKINQVEAIHDLAEMHNCNNFIYLESRRKIAFLWIGHLPEGPSAKFLLHSVHTSQELKLSGNCLKGSRPLLSFDSSFQSSPHLALLKHMFTQTLSVPLYHPKSMPFFDHVFSITHSNNHIFFRNFEVVEQDQASMVEIGPRFVLTPIKIFEKALSGPTLYKNGAYKKPQKEPRVSRYQEKLTKKPKREPKVVIQTEDASFKDVYG